LAQRKSAKIAKVDNSSYVDSASSKVFTRILTVQPFTQFALATNHNLKKRSPGRRAASFLPIAPLLLHPPVDGLHSIDFAADKSPHF